MILNLNITGETFEQVERYLLNEMTVEEKLEFEGRIPTDGQLRDAIDQVQLVILGVKEAALSATLNRFHREMQATSMRTVETARPGVSRRWLIAASFLVLAGLCSWWILSHPGKTAQVYSTYFKPDAGLISTMGSTDNYVFDKAMVDYKTGKYPAAIEAWTGLLKAHTDNDTLNYFVGAALLADNKEENALVYLKKVTLMKQSYFLADAYWYTGLALIRANRPKEAVEFIRQSGKPEAASLLKQLEH